jgi:hypothetical protein
MDFNGSLQRWSESFDDIRPQQAPRAAGKRAFDE